MSFKFDPFIILGVASSATNNDIQNAYDSLVDHLNSNPSDAATKQLELVVEAYTLLTNPTQRKQYDDYLEAISEEMQRTDRFNLRVTPSKRSVKVLEEE